MIGAGLLRIGGIAACAASRHFVGANLFLLGMLAAGAASWSRWCASPSSPARRPTS
jgi:hypothetical protein